MKTRSILHKVYLDTTQFIFARKKLELAHAGF
jgi:hypothetical protein